MSPLSEDVFTINQNLWNSELRKQLNQAKNIPELRQCISDFIAFIQASGISILAGPFPSQEEGGGEKISMYERLNRLFPSFAKSIDLSNTSGIQPVFISMLPFWSKLQMFDPEINIMPETILKTFAESGKLRQIIIIGKTTPEELDPYSTIMRNHNIGGYVIAEKDLLQITMTNI